MGKAVLGAGTQSLSCPSHSRAAHITLTGLDDRLQERDLSIWALVLSSYVIGEVPVPLLA